MTEDAPKPMRPRLVARQKSDRARIIPIGRRKVFFQDSYAWLLSATWPRLMLGVIVTYLIFNFLFACLYWITGDGISGARPGSFADLFFFSVETFATIGYGAMSPQSLNANIIMTAEAVTGFIFYALVTGLMFSRFSRPTSRVIFSNQAVVSDYNGQRHLMIRLANERGNRIVDATIHMLVLMNETTREGHHMRRFHDMGLARSFVPLLQLTWTALHPLDERSPLYGMTLDMLRERDAEVIISLTGLDETLSQTIHARFSYLPDEVAFDSMFADIIHRKPGAVEVHFNRFHEIKPLSVSGIKNGPGAQ